jgi:2-polyprenyl-3-methyl-5-hydroxy-6-metoxy-1,4-benzoquinol methylase
VTSINGYQYEDARHNNSHQYLMPALASILSTVNLSPSNRRIFELGCGNGSTAAFLHAQGYDVTGVDPSVDGIRQAQQAYPHLKLTEGDCYTDLASKYGQFPVVISLEVVEHVFLPREFAKRVFDLLDKDGVAIISSPFHGYWKNVLLALSGKLDSHFTALWDYGHIKFWSEKTLAQLLREAGFGAISFQRVGRIRPLAKSMIAIARR